jgi:hypothetical protein
VLELAASEGKRQLFSLMLAALKGKRGAAGSTERW